MRGAQGQGAGAVGKLHAVLSRLHRTEEEVRNEANHQGCISLEEAESLILKIMGDH